MKSLFERLAYIVVTIALTALMLFTLIFLIDKQSLYQISDKVPVFNKFMPDPQPAELTDEQAIIGNQKDMLAELNDTVATQTDSISKLEEEVKNKDAEISTLKAETTKPENTKSEVAETDEDHKLKLQQTANIYAKMDAKKAAPILESMTMSERALMLTLIPTDSQVDILERMTPQVAADTSAVLRDAVTAKDASVADIIAQIATVSKKYEKTTTTTSTTSSKEDLSTTFAQMTPSSAADILVELYSANPSKVIAIMQNIDSQSRANILASIATNNKALAATITSKLNK